MKTVNTVTFHTAMNYGAILQAYALQQVLLQKYHTQILNYDPVTISANYRCFKHPHGTPKEKISQFLNDIMRCPKDFRRNQRFRDFRKQFLHETTHFVTSQEVDSHYPRADVYITGSDQIWNPIITKGLDPIYTLNFGKNDFKKISYAASTGNNNAIKNDINMLVGQLQNFDAISVREKQLQQLLSTKDINDVTLTLDPSLLLTKNEWQKIIPNDYRPNRKYILAYSWEESEDFFRAINQLAQQMGCMIYYYRRHDYKNLFHAPKKSYFDVGPQEFLALIQNAECVFTTSFHGTALSAILNKEFFVFLAKYTDRITTLLDSIGLSDRIVTDMKKFNHIAQQEINWNKVNQLLDQNRRHSLKWLHKAID